MSRLMLRRMEDLKLLELTTIDCDSKGEEEEGGC